MHTHIRFQNPNLTKHHFDNWTYDMTRSITNPIVFISLYSASSNLKNRQIFTSLLMAGVADIRRINDEHSAPIRERTMDLQNAYLVLGIFFFHAILLFYVWLAVVLESHINFVALFSGNDNLYIKLGSFSLNMLLCYIFAFSHFWCRYCSVFVTLFIFWQNCNFSDSNEILNTNLFEVKF